MDAGNLSRLVRRFGFEREERLAKDMFGVPFKLGRGSKFTPEEYETIKELLLLGMPRYKVAEKLGSSPSCITDVCKKIRWEEYIGGLGESS